MQGFDFDELEEQLPPERRVRVWAVSDVHTDMRQNLAWIEALSQEEFGEDVLVLAGDVSNKWEELEATLLRCRERFGRVFFVPGNHDLWVKKKEGLDSLEKMRRILELCERLGVETRPAEVAGLLLVPLLSWHQPQWDTEPEIEGWGGLRPVQQVVSDYALTRWPEGLAIGDGTVAAELDGFNEEGWGALLERREKAKAVLSFSHFLPRLEVNIEKRYLTTPALAKAVGSNYLRSRVERLRPDVHVFGHTHFGMDMVVEGVRYLQAPLAYPQEREARATTVAVGDFPLLDPRPCLVWSNTGGWAASYRGAWSEYYARYGRCPEVTSVLPAYVAASHVALADSCRVGWLPGRMPAWLFGPRAHREAEADRLIAAMRHRAAGGPEPTVMTVTQCLALQGRCTMLDVRRDAHCPNNGQRIQGSLALPYPAEFEALPSWPDEPLLAFCERLLARQGQEPLVLAGLNSDCAEAALLLAAMMRLRPQDVSVLQGGVRAWAAAGGPLELLPGKG